MHVDRGERRRLKMAWAVALVVHAVLFSVTLPHAASSLTERQDPQVVVLRRYVPPKPPVEQKPRRTVKRAAHPVPIPDPTPDEPEPIVAEDIVTVEEPSMIAPDVEFVVAAPSVGPPALEPDPGPVRAGVEVEAPVLLHRIDPEYPELARRARIEGVVILHARIDVEGRVVDVRVLRGLGLGLDEAAVGAVSQWRYRPTFYESRPVEVVLNVTIRFALR